MSVSVHHEDCMGTVFSFKIRGEVNEDAFKLAIKELHDADETFSLYKPESPLSALARGETSVDRLDPIVDEIWNECERWEQRTGGWFKAFTPQNTFDPSGLVKTWAAQRAADRLVVAGMNDFTLNAGGDVMIADQVSDETDWRIAIGKPVSIASAEAGVLTVFDLRNTQMRAVATSGSVERGQHIWNPKMPGTHQEELLQVSVIARDLVTADVWATAAFAEGIGAIQRLNQQPDIEALLVLSDGSLAGTDAIVPFFAKPN